MGCPKNCLQINYVVVIFSIFCQILKVLKGGLQIILKVLILALLSSQILKALGNCLPMINPVLIVAFLSSQLSKDLKNCSQMQKMSAVIFTLLWPGHLREREGQWNTCRRVWNPSCRCWSERGIKTIMQRHCILYNNLICFTLKTEGAQYSALSKMRCLSSKQNGAWYAKNLREMVLDMYYNIRLAFLQEIL